MKIKAKRDRKHGTMSIEIRAENHREGLALRDAVMGGMFGGRVKQAGEVPGTCDVESQSLQSVQTQKKSRRGTSQTSEK